MHMDTVCHFMFILIFFIYKSTPVYLLFDVFEVGGMILLM